MKIESLIFAYGAICFSMIAFNIVWIAVLQSGERRLYKRSGKFDRRLKKQMVLLDSGKTVEPQHLLFLEKRLSRVSNLMAFHEALTDFSPEQKERTDCYLSAIQPVFTYLSMVYLHRESVQSAYFAYLLSQYKIYRKVSFDAVREILKEYLKKDSFYCRQNAMKALYSLGEPEDVVDGIKIMDHQSAFFHGKIITDGLLTFQGDHGKLIECFWLRLEDFSVSMQVSILNYIRFQDGNYGEQMLAVLRDSAKDRELHFAAIRYFGKYYYAPAEIFLQTFAQITDPLSWEYAALSVSSLRRYPGRKTVEILKKAVTSTNWYVRYNAAQILVFFGLDYNDLIDVFSGNDRYAREMLTYRLGIRELTEKPEGKEGTCFS